jgi:HK97 family phage portal protein
MAKEPKRKGLKAVLRSWLLGPVSQFSGFPGMYINGIDAGVTVTSETALRFTAVFAAIKILSENIAGLPKSVMHRTPEGGFEPATSHPVHTLLHDRPNSFMNVFTFWFTMIAWMLGKGNAYAVIQYDRGKPSALHPVSPDWVKVVFVNGEKMYVVNSKDPDFEYLNGTYLDHEMLHFMLFTLDGLVGVDPIVYNAAAIGEGIAAQKFTADFFRTGGAIKGTLETDQSLGDDDYQRFMEHWRASAGNGETPLLEYGFKYKAINLSPEASQLLQTKTFSINDVARIYSIPPHMLSELSHATFSNIEHQTIQFVQYSIRPMVKRLEDELERKFFTGNDMGAYCVKFSLDGLLRGDTQARSAYYHNAILDGYMSRNEVRNLEGLEAAEGLDILLYPQNESIVSNDTDANEVLLAERLGVGGTQSLVSVLQDENLSDDQKKALLKLLFSFSDEELSSLFPKTSSGSDNDKNE